MAASPSQVTKALCNSLMCVHVKTERYSQLIGCDMGRAEETSKKHSNKTHVQELAEKGDSEHEAKARVTWEER